MTENEINPMQLMRLLADTTKALNKATEENERLQQSLEKIVTETIRILAKELADK